MIFLYKHVLDWSPELFIVHVHLRRLMIIYFGGTLTCLLYTRLRSFPDKTNFGLYFLNGIIFLRIDALAVNRLTLSLCECFFNIQSLCGVLLEKEVIGSRQMVMFIVMYSLFDKLLIEAHLDLHLGNKLLVNG